MVKTELSKKLGKLEEQVKELLQKIVQKDNDRKQEGKKLDICRNKSGVPGKNKKAGEEFIKKNMRNLLD